MDTAGSNHENPVITSPQGHAPPEPPRRRTVSVVMATFNGAPFVGEQLASLAAQVLPPTELVVCDDGSEDGTLDIVAAFAERAAFPVTIIRHETRLGFADNFLHGAMQARGDWIAFCDQDDVWHPEKLSRCVAALTKYRAMLALHSAEVVDRDLRPLGHTKPQFSRSQLLRKNFRQIDFTHPGFAMVFDRELLHGFDWRQRAEDAFRAPGRRFAHDQWIFFLAQAVGRIAVISDRLALYRQHGGNAFGATREAAPPLFEFAAVTNVQAYRRSAEVARYLGNYLDALVAAARPARQDALRASAAAYHRFARIWAARADLNAEAAVVARCRTFVTLLGRGAYFGLSRQSLGWRSAFKDAAMVFVRRT